MNIFNILIYILIGIGFSTYVYTTLYGDAKPTFYLFGIIAWPIIFIMSVIITFAEWITDWFDDNDKNGGCFA